MIFHLLHPYEDRVFTVGDYPFHLRIVLACVVARICSSLYNFVLNRKFVFQDGRKQKNRVFSDILKYYILAIFLLLGSLLLTELCSRWIPAQFMTAAKVVVDLFLFGISYFAQRYIVFR